MESRICIWQDEDSGLGRELKSDIDPFAAFFDQTIRIELAVERAIDWLSYYDFKRFGGKEVQLGFDLPLMRIPQKFAVDGRRVEQIEEQTGNHWKPSIGSSGWIGC